MEKCWFEHNSGYINIKDNNIYFTNTGNWTETEEISQNQPFNKSRSNQIKGFIYLIIVGVVILIISILNMTRDESFIWLALLAITIKILGLYKYFKRDISSNFYITFSSISNISIDEDQCIIEYESSYGKKESIKLSKIPRKGLIILKELRDKLILSVHLSSNQFQTNDH